jgi:hypothetical protein
VHDSRALFRQLSSSLHHAAKPVHRTPFCRAMIGDSHADLLLSPWVTNYTLDMSAC